MSAAQEGLVRVFDRMLEVDPTEVARCRLLVGPGLVGAVMGAGGNRVNKITKETGGFVKIFGPSDLLPPCADSSDELIQISGGCLAVKKALVVVSRYIQQKTLQNIAGASGSPVVLRPSMKMETGDAAIDNGVNEKTVAEVVLKLLCPWDAAGAVIGFRGKKVKALEEETGASIRFSAVEDNCAERVITVTAFENRKSHHSTAQNALVRVFNELMSSGENGNVTARILIQPSQSGCLEVRRDSILSDIMKASGAALQILEQSYTYAGASTDEKVVQIEGDYSSVQIALYQVSWMLRECAFGAVSTTSNSPLPHQLFNLPPYVDERAALTEKMKNCRVIEESNGSLPSNFQHSEVSSGHFLSASIEHPRDSTKVKGGPQHGSGSRSVVVTNTKMEIAVRGDLFGTVFADDGFNLSRLRMISGAEVEVQDLGPGSDGKVIISGTPDQTLVAQSLLQAFIMAAQ